MLLLGHATRILLATDRDELKLRAARASHSSVARCNYDLGQEGKRVRSLFTHMKIASRQILCLPQRQSYYRHVATSPLLLPWLRFLRRGLSGDEISPDL